MKRISTALMRGEAVKLSGGPMDGWIVKPDAPALREGWYATLPQPHKDRFKPGRYYLSGTDKRLAIWKETPQ